MARETEKDYDHTYFRRGEQALINDYGKPDYVTHNAERAFYHYRREDGKPKKPFVVLIQNYCNPQDEIMRKMGWKPDSAEWAAALENMCFNCECWVCPCGLLDLNCVREQDEDEDIQDDDEFEDLEGIEGWQGCRSCWYCWKGAMAIVPLGEGPEIIVIDDDDDEQQEQEEIGTEYEEGSDNHEMWQGYSGPVA
ncbi:hypothetical protein ABW21_db0202000 [Orbilia brochopaga]|nr:hypothetical protein ABW21_db0202000 [Drechslerella brochopaga]